MQLLTKEQLEAWQDFGPPWAAFKEAWLSRGFLWPPSGTAEDEFGASLRSRLWPIVDARPTEIAKWIRDAPGPTQWHVVGYLFDQWDKFRNSIALDESDTLRTTVHEERPSDPGTENPRAGAGWRVHGARTGPTSIGDVLRSLDAGPRERPSTDGQEGTE